MLTTKSLKTNDENEENTSVSLGTSYRFTKSDLSSLNEADETDGEVVHKKAQETEVEKYNYVIVS